MFSFLSWIFFLFNKQFILFRFQSDVFSSSRFSEKSKPMVKYDRSWLEEELMKIRKFLICISENLKKMISIQTTLYPSILTLTLHKDPLTIFKYLFIKLIGAAFFAQLSQLIEPCSFESIYSLINFFPCKNFIINFDALAIVLSVNCLYSLEKVTFSFINLNSVHKSKFRNFFQYQNQFRLLFFLPLQIKVNEPI